MDCYFVNWNMGCVLNLNWWRIFLVNIEYSPLAAWCDLVTYCSHPDEIPVVMDTIRSVCCYKICIKIKPLVLKETSSMKHYIYMPWRNQGNIQYQNLNLKLWLLVLSFLHCSDNVETCIPWLENTTQQIDLGFNIFFMVYFFIRVSTISLLIWGLSSAW